MRVARKYRISGPSLRIETTSISAEYRVVRLNTTETSIQKWIGRAIVYLSFLSMPGAKEKNFLVFTLVYLGMLFVSSLLLLLLNWRRKIFTSSNEMGFFVAYIAMILLHCVANYTVATRNGIDLEIWLSRAIHLILIPIYFISFRTLGLSSSEVLNNLIGVGFVETLLVYASLVIYRDQGLARRATDIEGVTVYSVCLVLSAYYCIKSFNQNRGAKHLVLYALVFGAAILTGTRILVISIAAVVLQLGVQRKSIGALVGLLLVAITGNWLGLFARFDVSDFDNMITVTSKMDEIPALWRFFIENPLWGTGYGKAYSIPVANSEYTYTHNILMFYLGYGGLTGALVALLPLFWLVRGHGYILVASILIFYTSSTTYTNLKHSIVLAWATMSYQSMRSKGHVRLR